MKNTIIFEPGKAPRMTTTVVVYEKGKEPRYVTGKEADRINMRRLEDAYDKQAGYVGYNLLGLMACIALTVAIPGAAPMVLIACLGVVAQTVDTQFAKAAYERAKADYYEEELE